MFYYFTLGLILPLLTQLISRTPGQRLVIQRTEIQSQLVDRIQGIADLLAFGCGMDRWQQISAAGEHYSSTQKQLARINGTHSALGILLRNLGVWLVLVLVIPQ